MYTVVVLMTIFNQPGVNTMLSNKIRDKINKFNRQVSNAIARGFEVHPSVNGAWLYDPAKQKYLGNVGSAAWIKATKELVQ